MKHLLLVGSLSLLLLSDVSKAQNIETKTVAPPRTVSSPPYADTDTTENTELLSAQVEKAVFDGGEMVKLKITIKNTTDKPLLFFKSSVEPDYQIQVYKVTQAKDGKEVLTLAPLTEYGKSALVSPGGVSISVNFLKTGETRQDSLTVNRLFDMTLSGKYSIIASRYVNHRLPLIGRQSHRVEKKPIRLVCPPVLVEIR